MTLFFHFGGYNPLDLITFSVHENRFKSIGIPFSANRLLTEYVRKLTKNDMNFYAALPCKFDSSSTANVTTSSVLKKTYRESADPSEGNMQRYR